MATTRARLHKLIDALQADQFDEAGQALRDLAVPIDDEPYTDEDLAAIAETRAELARGEPVPHGQAMRSLGL